MSKKELFKLFDEVLEKYQSSEESVIYDRSGSIRNDLNELKIEIEEYRMVFGEILNKL